MVARRPSMTADSFKVISWFWIGEVWGGAVLVSVADFSMPFQRAKKVTVLGVELGGGVQVKFTESLPGATVKVVGGAESMLTCTGTLAEGAGPESVTVPVTGRFCTRAVK